MKLFNQDNYIKKQNTILIISLLVHAVFFIINLFVGGYHCDEAMTIMNARSLADYGTDIMGEKLPVYFDTWLYGGQSPMATYIMALSVKILGASYFACRLPIFVVGMLGLIALRSFLNEVFLNGKQVKPESYTYVFVILTLASFAPWHIFSSTFMLDCNFLPHLLIIGMMFFAKALNNPDKKLYFVASMVFFGLCFYCYIASVLTIPVFLAILFLVLIAKKRISLLNVLISALTIFVVAIPFILFGLVTIGVIEPFSILGFSFSEMPYYNRAGSLTFNNTSGILGTIKYTVSNLLRTFFILAFPDCTTVDIDSMFCYTNLIGGIIMFFGMLAIIIKTILKKPIASFKAKLFGVCSVAAVLSFCVLSTSGEVGLAYRFGTMFYLLIFIEGIGFVEICKLIKRINIKVKNISINASKININIICSVFMALSFILFSAEYAFLYAPNINTATSVYGDSFYDCISFVEDDCEAESFTVCAVLWHGSAGRNERQAAFLRNYHYDKKFNDYEGILKSTGLIAAQNNWSEPVPQITEDNSIVYQDIWTNNVITDNFNIILTDAIELADYDSEKYSVNNFGIWSVIYYVE